jgi:glycosyltransferase involved in cell wall biosynthesis
LFGVGSVPEYLAGHSNLRSVREKSPTHSGLRAHLWEQLSLPQTASRYDLDLFHTPAGQPPLLSGIPLVTTVHDVSPIVHPEWFSKRYATLYRVLTPLAIRASDRIITPSKFARDEIIDAYPSATGKTVAIHNGLTPGHGSGTPVDGLKADDFLLFVGSSNPRKNVATLLQAYRRYRRSASDPLTLALAGPDREVFASTDRPAVEGVHALGFVSDDELTWLYHNARAFVFPSLYEGFGLPILEAMSLGTPVITSNRGAMAEVAGDAAHLVDPTDPDALAQGIHRVLDDGEYADALCEAGQDRAGEFTWERTARETLDVYREVANL